MTSVDILITNLLLQTSNHSTCNLFFSACIKQWATLSFLCIPVRIGDNLRLLFSPIYRAPAYIYNLERVHLLEADFRPQGVIMLLQGFWRFHVPSLICNEKTELENAMITKLRIISILRCSCNFRV